MQTLDSSELIKRFFSQLRLAQYQFFLMVNDHWTRTPLDTVQKAVFARPLTTVMIETGKLQYGKIYAVIDFDSTQEGVDIIVDWSYNDVHVDEEIQRIIDSLQWGIDE